MERTLTFCWRPGDQLGRATATGHAPDSQWTLTEDERVVGGPIHPSRILPDRTEYERRAAAHRHSPDLTALPERHRLTIGREHRAVGAQTVRATLRPTNRRRIQLVELTYV